MSSELIGEAPNNELIQQILLSILFFLITIGMLSKVSWSIAKPIFAVTGIASRFAQGDEIKFYGEFRSIIHGLNTTLDSMITLVNGAMRLASGYARGTK